MCESQTNSVCSDKYPPPTGDPGHEDDSEKVKIVRGPTLAFRIQLHFNSILPRLALPAAVLSGCALTAGTTYALVRHVQHLIANAKVEENPARWMQEARTNAYDACYFGCNDCGDINWAYNACAMTAKANVTGITCDGNKIWNWEKRYPIECLQAVGEFYKAMALKRLKQSYRNQLAVIILTVLAGLVAFVLVLKIWKKMTWRCKMKADKAREEARVWPQARVWSEKKSYSAPEKGLSSAKRTKGRRGFGRVMLIFTSFAALFGKTHAYPCTGYSHVADQYFVNANNTIFGVVHGWVSDCYDYICDCSTTCSGGDGSAGSFSSCTTTCSTCTAIDKSPSDYVMYTLPKIKRCGFKLVDAVEGDVNLRIANALIEKDLWVKVSVNAYNASGETDPSIFCLHGIAT
jgi:hypothetical protein